MIKVRKVVSTVMLKHSKFLGICLVYFDQRVYGKWGSHSQDAGRPWPTCPRGTHTAVSWLPRCTCVMTSRLSVECMQVWVLLAVGNYCLCCYMMTSAPCSVRIVEHRHFACGCSGCDLSAQLVTARIKLGMNPIVSSFFGLAKSCMNVPGAESLHCRVVLF